MTPDPSFSMALRSGNWGRVTMLPSHKPVRLLLAPAGSPDQLVRFECGLTAVPDALTTSEVHTLSVEDVRGVAGGWELRLEGEEGVLVFYSQADERLPTVELIDELAARLAAG
jgi:hypothetical protein